MKKSFIDYVKGINVGGEYYPIKHVDFPNEFDYIKSVEVNGTIYNNKCYRGGETKRLVTPLQVVMNK